MASVMANIPALKDLHQDLKRRMEKSVEEFRAHLLGVRTGRASVHMLDNIRVDYYGSEMPINQLAQINTPEPQLIGKTQSHGCLRMTNWDVMRLSLMMKLGFRAKFVA